MGMIGSDQIVCVTVSWNVQYCTVMVPSYVTILLHGYIMISVKGLND